MNKVRDDFILSYILEDIQRCKLTYLSVIDVGCGGGYLLHRLYDYLLNQYGFGPDCINLVGIDKLADFEVGNVIFHKEDILDLEKLYDENTFDFAICSDVLEHVVDTDKLLRQIRRILRPGGILYLTTPNMASYHGRLSLLMGYLPLACEISNEYSAFGKGFLDKLYSKDATGEPLHHIRVFTYRALKEFLIYHKFNILNITGFDYRVPWLWKKIPSIAPVDFAICKKKI